MTDNFNLELQSIFLEFEKKTLGLRLKSNSKIYELFKICLGNWRFLITTNNYDELRRKFKIFVNALVDRVNNPFIYGSKKRKKEYLFFVFKTESFLNNKANGV